MLKNKLKILLNILLILLILGIFMSDLAYKFGNHDIPFIVTFIIYFFFIIFNHFTSKITFLIVILLTVFMGISYINSGEIRFTERIGEWLYLFFLFGLFQYTFEVGISKKLIR